MSRPRQILGVIGAIVGTAVTFVCALVAGLLLHVNLPATHRIAKKEIRSVLASTVRGTLIVEHIGRIGRGGVSGLRVRVLDPEGTQVLYVDGAVGQISLYDTVKSAIFGKGDIDIQIRSFNAEYADVNLDTDESGTPRIGNAFEPRAKTPSVGPSRGVRVEASVITVHHGWVHGTVSGLPTLDATADAVHGALLISPKDGVIIDGATHVITRGMPRGGNAKGDAVAHVTLPSKTGKFIGVAATFKGDFGGIPAGAQASLDGRQIDGTVDFSTVGSDKIRALLSEAPVYEDVSGHGEVHGEITNLGLKAHLLLGKGTVDVTGALLIGQSDPRLNFRVLARHLELRGFAPDAPDSDLNADADVVVVLPPTPTAVLRGEFSMDLFPGQIAKNDIPRGTLVGSFSPQSVEAKVRLAEPGAPTEAKIRVLIGPPGTLPEIDFDVTTNVPNLNKVTRLGPIANGSVRAHVIGKVRLADLTMNAQVEGDLTNVGYAAAHMRTGHVSGTVAGPLAKLHVDATLHGRGLTLEKDNFATAVVHARGPVTQPVVDATLEGPGAPKVVAHATLQFNAGITIHDGTVTVTRDDVTVTAHVDTVRVNKGNVRIEGVHVEGLGGEPVLVNVRVTPAGLLIQAKATEVDIRSVAYLVHLENKFRKGRVSFDVDLLIGKKSLKGEALLDFHDAAFTRFKDARGHVHGTFLGTRVLTASAHLELGLAGVVDLNTSSIEINGPPLEAATWMRAAGKVQIDAAVDLDDVAALIPKDVLPFGSMSGKVVLEGQVGRDTPAELPEVDISLQTRGLILTGKPAVTPPPVPPPWKLVGIEVGIDARVDAATGHSELSARLSDGYGALLALDAKSYLPYRDLLEHPERALKRMQTVPVTAHLTTPSRGLDQLPPMFQAKGMKGTVSLSANAAGTLVAPKVDFDLRTRGARVTSAVAASADVQLTGKYDGTAADFELKMTTPTRTTPANVLAATAHIDAKIADLLASNGNADDLPWDGSANLRVFSFPLQTIGVLADHRVRGNVSGEVTLKDFHKNARVRGQVSINTLRIATTTYSSGLITANIDDHAFTGSLRLDQPDGFAEANATVGTSWGKKLAPSVDDSQPSELSLKARAFRLAAALPFVEHIFSELDGRIDADAHVHAEKGVPPRMDGLITLREGVFETPAIGEEFQHAQGRMTIHPDGTILVENVSANGVTGKFAAAGSARMEGLKFVSARAAIRIPQRQPLPLSINGQEIGDTSGNLDVSADMSGDRRTLNVAVDIPTLHTRLPDTGTRSVQDLDPAPHVRVGVHTDRDTLVLLPLGPPEPPPRPDEALRIHMAINLGSDVVVQKGGILKVSLTGRPVVDVDETVHVTGQIQLTGGTLQVQGKLFRIDHGTISFVGDDPSDPLLVVTAIWDAPDNTQIIADYVGPLKTGRVTLRSEPPLPQDQILSLIIFGTANGVNGAPSASQTQGNESPGATTQAGAAGGGIATQGANKAIQDLTGTDVVQTRVDTSESQNPRPEVQVQIAHNLSVLVAYVLGVFVPGQNPDTALATVNWRFVKNLSLETTLGNAGTSIVDLIWQYRY